MICATSAALTPSPSCGSTSHPSGTGAPSRSVASSAVPGVASAPAVTGRSVPSFGSPRPTAAPTERIVSSPGCGPPGPTMSRVMPTRSMRPNGSPNPAGSGTPPRSPTGACPAYPPTAANAIHSASSDRSGFVGSNVELSCEFSSVANPVLPAKNTPMPPTT